eukprot:11958116-Prorocentrum_lima.AAC.1
MMTGDRHPRTPVPEGLCKATPSSCFPSHSDTQPQDVQARQAHSLQLGDAHPAQLPGQDGSEGDDDDDDDPGR